MNNLFGEFGIAVLRVIVGLAMASHGYQKIFGGGMEEFIAYVGGMGFHPPAAFAWMAALSELLGGLCLVAGLSTRFCVFMIGCTMSVAFFVAHAEDPFAKKELALIFLATMVYFLCNGGGAISLDALIARRAKGT